jgi:hypothetical protein
MRLVHRMRSFNPHRERFPVNKFARIVRSPRAALASLAVVGAPAFAAVPTEVTTALGDMKTDALAVAALVLVAIIAVAAFKFMRRGISG